MGILGRIRSAGRVERLIKEPVLDNSKLGWECNSAELIEVNGDMEMSDGRMDIGLPDLED